MEGKKLEVLSGDIVFCARTFADCLKRNEFYSIENITQIEQRMFAIPDNLIIGAMKAEIAHNTELVPVSELEGMRVYNVKYVLTLFSQREPITLVPIELNLYPSERMARVLLRTSEPRKFKGYRINQKRPNSELYKLYSAEKPEFLLVEGIEHLKQIASTQ